MNSLDIETIISLEPMHLGSKLVDYVNQKIQREYVGQCDQNYGYIVKVQNQVQKEDLYNNMIASTGACVRFKVRLNIQSLKPETGREYEGVVRMIYSHGIFATIMDKLQVFIPADQIHGYKYDKVTNNFTAGKQKISMGNTIPLIINIFKYEKRGFECIGSLKN